MVLESRPRGEEGFGEESIVCRGLHVIFFSISLAARQEPLSSWPGREGLHCPGLSGAVLAGARGGGAGAVPRTGGR